MSENVILVTVDSLRADHCGFGGYDRATTPTLDRMAERGTSFDHAIAPGPRTPESMPVCFTGTFLPDELPTDMVPQRSIITEHMATRTTLPERLSAMGYETIGITPNPFTSRYFGFDAGFDQYVDFIGEGEDGIYDRLFRGWLGGDTVSNVMRLGRNMIQREEVFKPWEAYYDRIQAAIESASEPYFVWVFSMDVHEPYIAGSGYHSLSMLERWKAIWKLYLGDKETPFDDRTVERLITAYDDSIEYTDAFIERLLDDASDDPTVVVHGDHGEAFGEHGVYSHEPYLYEENVHVPLVISEPTDLDTSVPISLRQLPELVTGLARDDLDPAQFDHPYAVARTSRERRIAVRGNDWKYVATPDTSEVLDLAAGETAIEAPDRAALGEAVVARVREQDREFERIREAAAAVDEKRSDRLRESPGGVKP